MALKRYVDMVIYMPLPAAVPSSRLLPELRSLRHTFANSLQIGGTMV